MNGQRPRPGARALRTLTSATAILATALATGGLPVSAQTLPPTSTTETTPAPVETTPRTTPTETTPTPPAPAPVEPPPFTSPIPAPAPPPSPPAERKDAPRPPARKREPRPKLVDPQLEPKRAPRSTKPKAPAPPATADPDAPCVERWEQTPDAPAEPKRHRPQADARCAKPHAKKSHPRPEASLPAGPPSSLTPGFVDALSGPSVASGVPNFVIRKFRVPPFLLPIYQAAGIEYGIRWEILAAINEIETDYGRNLNVSSAGALGWMQFMPSTWKAYGTDANKDGRKDPYNPVDAIFAAARYLKAANYQNDVRAAIWAYNHADWYVDSVLLRARLIAGVPADLIGSLTGLTEGRFPVYARARYADDLAEQGVLKRAKAGENAANVIESDDNRRGIEIFAREGSPVVAVNDGVVKEIGTSKRLGRYLILQDVYGNRYTYGHLGKVARTYPVPKQDANSIGRIEVTRAHDDPRPVAPASAGRQPTRGEPKPAKVERRPHRGVVATKRRLFAHPDMPQAQAAGGLEQLLTSKQAAGGQLSVYRNGSAPPLRLDPSQVRLRVLKEGSHVIGGTILGRIGAPDERASHLRFEIRPAGKGAPRIDPKPILDGWKLLEATAIYRASGRNVLHGDDEQGAMSIGQILLLPKPLLEKRVLADERVQIYAGGRDDIRSGQIDRRVLATLEYLAESGLRPTITSLRNGHGFYTASGNVSEHSSGNAVDIAAINGIPILGHQDAGGITDQTVRRIMQLQGTIRPHQIISLLDYGQNTLALADHNDHIHVGFQPLFGPNTKLARQAMTVLEPNQWSDLLERLGEIDNPVVPTKPSKYALPARGRR